jgi:hypothetical protein
MTKVGADRFDQVTEKFNMAQGELLERLLYGLSDDEISAALTRGGPFFLQARNQMRDYRRQIREIAETLALPKLDIVIIE